MKLKQIRDLTMTQMGLEPEDAREMEPQLTQAINEGYDRLLDTAAGLHCGPDAPIPPLRAPCQVPELPEWSHRALADWAVYRLCLTGGAGKARRALLFRDAFDETRLRMLAEKYSGRFLHTR